MELKTKTEIQRQRKNKEPRSDFFHHVRVLCPRFWDLEITKFGIRENQRGFQFRWLKINEIYSAFPILITLFSNHLK